MGISSFRKRILSYKEKKGFYKEGKRFLKERSRFTKENKRFYEEKRRVVKEREQALLKDPDIITAANRRGVPTEILASDLAIFTENQRRRILQAYTDQTKSSELLENLPYKFYDPIEDNPAIKNIIESVRAEAEKMFPDKLGKCNYVWDYMEAKLHQQGIDWISPTDMNPHMRFD